MATISDSPCLRFLKTYHFSAARQSLVFTEPLQLEADQYEQIGRLTVKLEWAKKLPGSTEAKRAMIEVNHPDLSMRRQCKLLDLNRATFYYQPATETALNLALMPWIDVQYTKTPFYGWPRITPCLNRMGYDVNHQPVQRLIQIMGLQAIYPQRRTSRSVTGHTVYPYALRNLHIVQPNRVWSADITYVPVTGGFM